MNKSCYLILVGYLINIQSNPLTPQSVVDPILITNDAYMPTILNDLTSVDPLIISYNSIDSNNQIPQTYQAENTCGAFKAKFKDGLNPLFNYEGPVTTNNGKLQIKFSKGDTVNPTTGVIQGYGGTASSAQTFLYGKFTARLKTARIGGVVTAFILMSAEKDEIDWEWVGKDEYSSQTNYFSKGILDYTKGQTIANNFNTHQTYHTYGIIWTPESITWTIDKVVVKTVTRESNLTQNGTYNFPDTPANIKLNVWDGGCDAPGTRDWAGGFVNYEDPEYVANGGFISTDVAWVKYECL